MDAVNALANGAHIKIIMFFPTVVSKAKCVFRVQYTYEYMIPIGDINVR